MGKFLKSLEGYRSYIVAAAGAIVQGLAFAGVISQEQANPILGILGFGAVAALRASVK